MRTALAESQSVETKTVEDTTAICLCHFCGTWITFASGQLGQLVNCPHCLMETVLHYPEADSPYSADKFRVEIRRMDWSVNELGFRCICGEVANRSTGSLDWVRVEFTLFDGAGNSVGVVSDSMTGLAPESHWKFKVPVHNPLVVRASLPVFSSEYGKTQQPKKSMPGPIQAPEDFERRKPRVEPGRSDNRRQ